MKIIIMSDSHRKDGNVQKVIERVKPFDMLIHLGDTEGSEDRIRDWCLAQNPDCEVHIVKGNNDFFSDLPREEVIDIAGHKALLTHGHYYGVSMGPERLAEEARNRGVEIAMFGHTHKPYLKIDDDLTLLNPGSISYPRQDGRKYTFMQMEVDRFGEVHYTESEV